MSELDIEDNIWVGKAFCTLSSERSEYEDGSRGAYVVFVVLAKSSVEAVDLIYKELMESHLEVRGFEYIYDSRFIDRETTDYENNLIARLDSYPVQFENVHFFKSDG